MFIALHLDVDNAPHAYGPFATEELANAKLAELVNAHVADEIAAGRSPIDIYTDQPVVSPVTVKMLTEYLSDLTGYADYAVRYVSPANPSTDFVDIFTVTRLTP